MSVARLVACLLGGLLGACCTAPGVEDGGTDTAARDVSDDVAQEDTQTDTPEDTTTEGPLDQGDTAHDISIDRSDATVETGWERIGDGRCPFERALDPGTAYRMEWEPCPSADGCQWQVLDARFSGDILPKRPGQRLPGMAPILAFIAFEPDLTIAASRVVTIIATLDGETHVVLRQPPSRADCLIATVGSNGEHGAYELYYPDNTSDFYHAPLDELNEATTPIGHFEPGDQLGTGAQRLTVSSTHVLAQMASLIWVMDGERMVRRGGPLDLDGATHAFGSNTSILGDRIVGGLDGWFVGTFDRVDGPPIYLHERTTLRSTIHATTGDGEHWVWVEQKPEAPLELWASPFATTPEGMDAQRIAELETFRLPILGDGRAAILEDPNVLVVDLETGERTRLAPPEGHVFWTDVAAVSRDELIAVVSRRGERRARYIRYDLTRATFE